MTKWYEDTRLDDIVNSLNKKYRGKYKFESEFFSDIDNQYRIDICGYVYDKKDKEYYSIGWIAFGIEWTGYDWIVSPDNYNTPKDDAVLKNIAESVKDKILEIFNDYYEEEKEKEYED